MQILCEKKTWSPNCALAASPPWWCRYAQTSARPPARSRRRQRSPPTAGGAEGACGPGAAEVSPDGGRVVRQCERPHRLLEHRALHALLAVESGAPPNARHLTETSNGVVGRLPLRRVNDLPPARRLLSRRRQPLRADSLTIPRPGRRGTIRPPAGAAPPPVAAERAAALARSSCRA